MCRSPPLLKQPLQNLSSHIMPNLQWSGLAMVDRGQKNKWFAEGPIDQTSEINCFLRSLRRVCILWENHFFKLEKKDLLKTQQYWIQRGLMLQPSQCKLSIQINKSPLQKYCYWSYLFLTSSDSRIIESSEITPLVAKFHWSPVTVLKSKHLVNQCETNAPKFHSKSWSNFSVHP